MTLPTANAPGLGAVVAGLWLGVLVSAIGVTYSSHQCRQLYSELAALRSAENRLQVEWGQFLLEQSSWAALGRVERIAVDKLSMRVPETSEIVVVQP